MTKRVGPCVYVTNLPRTVTRQSWKLIYRLLRVTQREAEKVRLDCMLFGNGFMLFPSNGDPQHIPLEKVIIKS